MLGDAQTPRTADETNESLRALMCCSRHGLSALGRRGKQVAAMVLGSPLPSGSGVRRTVRIAAVNPTCVRSHLPQRRWINRQIEQHDVVRQGFVKDGCDDVRCQGGQVDHPARSCCRCPCSAASSFSSLASRVKKAKCRQSSNWSKFTCPC
jgi:hypothetical protein